MNDLDINIALAKAMGWDEDDISMAHHKQNSEAYDYERGYWRPFDYRDPVIFVAICKRWMLDVRHGTCVAGYHQDRRVMALESGNIERAAAMVVIELFKRGVK